MTLYPSEIIAQHTTDSVAVIDDLRTAGWIIVRHDAIRLAQVAARYEADNDNVPGAILHKTPTNTR